MVVNIIQLYLVCPATTANAERSFSQLRRIKTYLRSTMNQRRLNALLILSTYHEELDSLNIYELANDFVMKMKQGVQFLVLTINIIEIKMCVS